MLLLLGGAHPNAVESPADACASFDEISVTDPGGIARPLELDGIDPQRDLVAKWTGLVGVCVPEVRLLTDEEVSAAVFDGGDAPMGVTEMPFYDMGEAVVRLDPASGTLAPVLPIPPDVRFAAPLPDGRLLAPWSLGKLRGWMLGDLSSGTWSLVTPDCRDAEGRDWRRHTTLGGSAAVLAYAASSGWDLLMAK